MTTQRVNQVEIGNGNNAVVIELDEGGAYLVCRTDHLFIPAKHRQAVALALMGQPDEAMVERAKNVLRDFYAGVDVFTDLYWTEVAEIMLKAIFGGGEQVE